MRSIGIKDTIISIKENIAINILPTRAHTLETTKTSRTRRIRRRKVQILRRNSSIIARPNQEAKRRQLSITREDIAALSIVQSRARDLSVVVGDGGVGHEDQSGAGVSDAGAGGAEGMGADFVGGAGEFPEATGVVDGGVFGGAGEFAIVDEAKVVGAIGILWEVGGEQWGAQG